MTAFYSEAKPDMDTHIQPKVREELPADPEVESLLQFIASKPVSVLATNRPVKGDT